MGGGGTAGPCLGPGWPCSPRRPASSGLSARRSACGRTPVCAPDGSVRGVRLGQGTSKATTTHPQEASAPAPKRRSLQAWVLPATLIVGLAGWAAVAHWSGLPPFLLPSPGDVWDPLSLRV